MIDAKDVRQATKGREEYIFSQLLTQKEFSGRTCPCPACGGDDRFQYSKKKQKAYCRSYGRYLDPLALAVHMENDSVPDGVKRIADLLGIGDLSEDDRHELKRKADLEIKRKAKLEKEVNLRRYNDSKVVDSLFELDELITRRNGESEPDDYESDLATDLISLLKSRYSLE